MVAIPASAGTKTVIANLIGGAIFFWVDRWIFKKDKPVRSE
jgi:hypothetical protein